MDNAEVFIRNLPPIDIHVRHLFVPGLYVRQMHVKAGGIVLSKVHKTEHAFMVTMGKILVYDGDHEAVILKSPFTGVTLPDTRRVGIALEDTVWVTMHPTKIKPINDSIEAVEAAVAKIERKVIQPYKNILI